MRHDHEIHTGLIKRRGLLNAVRHGQHNHLRILRAKLSKQQLVSLEIRNGGNRELDRGKIKAGMDFVIMPHFLGGKYASEIVESYWYNETKFKSLREKHLTDLSSRLAAGGGDPPRGKGKGRSAFFCFFFGF